MTFVNLFLWHVCLSLYIRPFFQIFLTASSFLLYCKDQSDSEDFDKEDPSMVAGQIDHQASFYYFRSVLTPG
jgi:hypothetical protein